MRSPLRRPAEFPSFVVTEEIHFIEPLFPRPVQQAFRQYLTWRVTMIGLVIAGLEHEELVAIQKRNPDGDANGPDGQKAHMQPAKLSGPLEYPPIKVIGFPVAQK